MRKTLLGAAVLLLAACGTPVPDGTVVDMYRTAPYTWWQSVCYAYNKNGMCTYRSAVPIHESEKWVVTLENCEYKDDGDDSCPQQRYTVSQELYGSLSLGDYLDTEPNE